MEYIATKTRILPSRDIILIDRIEQDFSDYTTAKIIIYLKNWEHPIEYSFESDKDAEDAMTNLYEQLNDIDLHVKN